MAPAAEHPLIRHLPNALTVVRLLLVPVFCVLMVEAEGRTTAAAIVFLVAAVSDFFDGAIARKAGVMSQFGKVADPLADRLLVNSAAILLSLYDTRLPPWAFLIVFARDIFAVCGFILVRRRVLPNVSRTGKLGTALVMAGLAWMLLLDESHMWPVWAFWIGVACSVVSFFQYIVRYRWVLRRGGEDPRAPGTGIEAGVYSGPDGPGEESSGTPS